MGYTQEFGMQNTTSHRSTKLEKVALTRTKTPKTHQESVERIISNNKPILSNDSKDTWDLLFNFNASAGAHAGVETNGTNFFTTAWNGATFTQYDMNGSNPVDFTIPNVSSIRDLTYDGTYFYGSAANMSIYKLDLVNRTLVSTISVTCSGVTGVRHITYDPTLDNNNGGFWIGNWNEMGAISMSGSQLIASVADRVSDCYGAAYDNYTDPDNPCLWLLTQYGSTESASTAIFQKFDINTLTLTNVSHDCANDIDDEESLLGGGTCSYVSDGKAILVGNIQRTPNLILAYEIASTVSAGTPAKVSGLTATPSSTGALSAVLNWTNPNVDVDGETLTSLTSLTIKRNGTIVHSINNPTVGGTETWTDNPTSAGKYTYTIYATNDLGDGMAASTSVFVGFDAEVISINEPVSSPNLTNSEVVKATIKNNGHYDITGFSLKLELNGTEVGTETYSGTIASGSQAEYTFTSTADLSVVKDHTIKVIVTLTGDGVTNNDTITTTVTNYGNIAIMGESSTITSCDISFVDDGINENYTYGDDQIITFYPETPGDMVRITFNELVTAVDPYFGSYDAIFVFNGAFTMDDLESLEDEYVLGAFAGDLTDELPEPITALNADGAITVYFMLGNYFGLTESGWQADITCVEPFDIDAAVASLEVPTTGTLTNSETITVTVVNLGGQSLSNIPVECKINGTALPTATIAGPLAPFATATQTFTADLSAFKTYDIVVYTNMTGDENHANDTATASTTSAPEAAITWDFEQGIPNDFTLRVLDNGVANNTTLFPNNEAWAIFTGDGGLSPIGTQCAVSQSWFSSGTGAANRWMITPRIELGEGLTMLQWDASCYEAEYADGYSIKLSTSNMETASFTKTLYTIASENQGWTNRIIDLSEYAGQKVYIAFIQDSDDMNIIAIDDIKILGTAQVTEDDLAVISKTPEGNNVNAYAAVSVTFNNVITLSNSSAITITPEVTGVTASANGNILTIAHDDFDYETEYTVTIPAGAIKDFDTEIKWSFTTKSFNIATEETNVISVYPNPSNGDVNIKVSENSTVKVTDITGKVIRIFDLKGNEKINFTQTPGMYFINVESNGKVYTKKLVIE